MNQAARRTWRISREPLGLHRISNGAGLSVDILPNGAVSSIEHRNGDEVTLINQFVGSPLDWGVGRILVRSHDEAPWSLEAFGPRAQFRLGLGSDRAVWEGATGGLAHRVTLQLHADALAWTWRLELTAAQETASTLDAIFIQDVGLGPRGFLANSEAYASQYIDHHVARHSRCGPVVMCRQNLAQFGRHPWVVHGCLDGAAAFATDGAQLFGAQHRDSDGIAAAEGTDLPSQRLQHEMACTGLQSRRVTVAAGGTIAFRFFGVFVPDHPAASDDSDLARIDPVAWAAARPQALTWVEPACSLLQRSRAAASAPLSDADVAARHPERWLEEREAGRLLSFFTPDGAHNRHVVLRGKERRVTRRHGAILRSGQAMLPDDATLCLTAWMHGVFGAQLTLGNTSLHQVLSVSRDPYNVLRASGLRLLLETGQGWLLLTVPSAFEMGLGDCRWIYRLDRREVSVSAAVSGEDAAVQWRIDVQGDPCRLLVCAHLVMGEREREQEGVLEVDPERRRIAMRPDPEGLWAQRYPSAVHHLVTSTPEAVEAIGGDELLYADGISRDRACVVLRTLPTTTLCFAVVGSLTDPGRAAALAARHEHGIDDDVLRETSARYWRHVTRGLRIDGEDPEARALDIVFPWFAHDAMVHLTVPHGLEQFTGAAWGTRDVCQGPVEFLLALEHDEPVRQILHTVFAHQYEGRGDWPQWFMLEPYAFIRDRESHGDIVVWPLKALNDYVEATGDFGFLDEPVGWRRDEDFTPGSRHDALWVHVAKLLATVVERFIPGTSLIRYGHGDWNDSLQPADPTMRDWMVSSWTVALLYQQVRRYAEILRRAGRQEAGQALETLAANVQRDFNRFLVRDGVVAGYALFDPGNGQPELLLHPTDRRTGLRYSLLPMTRSIIGGLFTPEQARHHLGIIREHLLFGDGVRLLDRPVLYRGGPERIFRRAESAAFFGREIGLMYVHAHIRYGEALAVLGEADALWEALQVVNPVSVTGQVANARLRQRNAYFSSSDAGFRDRYAADAEWERVRAAAVDVDGGWRIYSSGPGIYASLMICRAFGRRRLWGRPVSLPLLPTARPQIALALEVDAA